MAELAVSNAEAIRADLEFMTRRWGELDQPAVFEVRAFKETGAEPRIAKFAADWIDEAVDFIERLNDLGHNCYVTRNPLRHDYSGGAKDTDVLAAFFLWADCDEAGIAENVARFGGPAYSAAVTTGTAPHPRVHFYWELDQPCRDLALWRETQAAIAAHFGSDGKVINPSRIMRIGGTVAYPAPHKQAKEYRKETTRFRCQYEPPRPPVSMDQMRRVFLTAPPAQRATQAPAQGAFGLDMGQTAMDREAARVRALSGQEWHNEVIRLVASYVARGLADHEIHALTDPLTLPGYTVEETRREVQQAIDGARRKGFAPPPEWTPNFDHAPAPGPDGTAPQAPGWRLQHCAEFTADFVAPEYIVDGMIQRGRLYTLTAPTGSGKTAAMLYLSVCIAAAEQSQFCGLEVEKGDVIFLAGENPDDVRARVIGTLDHYGIDARSCRLHFIAGTFSIRQDMAKVQDAIAALPNVVAVIVDTFAAYFDGDDENSNAQALDFARVIRQITAAPSKPAVIMPAHPVKNAGKTNLTPKGGSSLLNEVDGNLTLWNSGGLLQLHWQGKFRGPEFEPLQLELKSHETEKLKDKRGRIMPTVFAKWVNTLRATQIAKETLRAEDAMLISIADDDNMTRAARMDALGLNSKNTYGRIIDRLIETKLIRKNGRRYVLTAAGREEVDRIQKGQQAPEDV